MLLPTSVLRRLCRSRDRLREETDAPLPVDAIAREAGLSPSQFLALFGATFGQTPHQLRIAARLDRARRLLARGDPVTEVCMEVGYASLGSFSDLFRRHVGASPSAYQRQARALAAVPGSLARHPGCFGLLGLLPATAFRGFREAPGAASTAHSPR